MGLICQEGQTLHNNGQYFHSKPDIDTGADRWSWSTLLPKSSLVIHYHEKSSYMCTQCCLYLAELCQRKRHWISHTDQHSWSLRSNDKDLRCAIISHWLWPIKEKGINNNGIHLKLHTIFMDNLHILLQGYDQRVAKAIHIETRGSELFQNSIRNTGRVLFNLREWLTKVH